MAHYLAVALTDVDFGVKEIFIYVNKRHGIVFVDNLYDFEQKQMEFTEVIQHVYKAVPKSLGSDINVEYVYGR